MRIFLSQQGTPTNDDHQRPVTLYVENIDTNPYLPRIERERTSTPDIELTEQAAEQLQKFFTEQLSPGLTGRLTIHWLTEGLMYAEHMPQLGEGLRPSRKTDRRSPFSIRDFPSWPGDLRSKAGRGRRPSTSKSGEATHYLSRASRITR
jgi:hypothetical protein